MDLIAWIYYFFGFGHGFNSFSASAMGFLFFGFAHELNIIFGFGHGFNSFLASVMDLILFRLSAPLDSPERN